MNKNVKKVAVAAAAFVIGFGAYFGVRALTGVVDSIAVFAGSPISTDGNGRQWDSDGNMVDSQGNILWSPPSTTPTPTTGSGNGPGVYVPVPQVTAPSAAANASEAPKQSNAPGTTSGVDGDGTTPGTTDGYDDDDNTTGGGSSGGTTGGSSSSGGATTGGSSTGGSSTGGSSAVTGYSQANPPTLADATAIYRAGAANAARVENQGRTYLVVVGDDGIVFIFDAEGTPLGYVILKKGQTLDDIDIASALIPFAATRVNPKTGAGIPVLPIVAVVVIGGAVAAFTLKKTVFNK